ncbi:hypothetical protein QR680_006934 [Steinernema hermaphroditum]|uniref:Uncharacterized protein n=1 Tax=Steinernema hermaphroditum TaxID=289476 RepID=A0AA39HZI6_9BILA|nr:hypothetical protein QR680_006934 [Steinernema hermaphroditum]
MQASKRFKKMKQLSRGDALQRTQFTDEKIFTVKPYRNSQNRRELLPKGSPRIVKAENIHFPKSVMVWRGISGLGKTQLVFVPKVVKINADIYREMILEGAVPLPGFWTKNVWQSNSPNLNPLKYAIRGIMEKKACAIKHKSIDSLKRALEKAWEEITPEMIAAILKNFLKRLDACIAAEGSYFECD